MRASHAALNAFGNANPQALAVMLQASQSQRIIAATDIFDISGIKLWASNQPVSSALQRQLLERQLRQPLESCLLAEDGVTGAPLGATLGAIRGDGHPRHPGSFGSLGRTVDRRRNRGRRAAAPSAAAGLEKCAGAVALFDRPPAHGLERKRHVEPQRMAMG